jgi:hypothetical protein
VITKDDWEEVRKAAYPYLDKQYPIDDPDSDEYRDDAPTLLKLIYEHVQVEASLINDADLQRDLRLRTTHYIFSRVVRLGVFLAKRQKRSDTASFDEIYSGQLRGLLDVDDELFARIFYLGRRIAEYVQRAGGALTAAKIKQVRRFARENLHNCKFCGAPLEFDEGINTENSLEVDHLFAQALGGTGHKANLAAACNRCNKLKDDRLSFVDIYHETFALATEDKGKVSPYRLPHVIFALLLKQHGKCFHCEREFYSLAPESIVLARREFDDYYHFRNCYIACQTCAARMPIDGVEVPIPVPKQG